MSHGFLKIRIDIPDGDLADLMRFTKAKTKRDAVLTAIQEFNRRRRMIELTKYAGTCADLLTVDELMAQRRRS